MPNARNKKDRILDFHRAQGLERVGLREIRAVEAELRRCYGPDDRTSPSYIANVLREAGAEVHYLSRFVDPWMEEPYASELKGVLGFRDLASAEICLRKLDAIYRKYREISDRVGTSLARELAIKGGPLLRLAGVAEAVGRIPAHLYRPRRQPPLRSSSRLSRGAIFQFTLGGPCLIIAAENGCAGKADCGA